MDASVTPEDITMWQQSQQTSVADNTAAPAEPEVVAEETPEAATQEDADTAVVAEEDEAAAETVEDAETAESTEDAAETSSVESGFDDLLDDIPSNERLLAEHRRIPDATKQALTGLADKAREYRTTLDRIGGNDGVEVLEPLHKLLTTSNPTDTDIGHAIRAAVTTNEKASQQLFQAGMDLLLNNETEPGFKAIAALGDTVLEERFGKGINAAKIEKYAALEEAGAFDLDAEVEVLDGFLHEKQAKVIEAQSKEIDRLQKTLADPNSAASEQIKAKQAVTVLDTQLSEQIEKELEPFRSKVNWNADSKLHQRLVAALKADLQNEPEYQELRALAQQGTVDGHTHKLNVSRYLNKLKARYANDLADISKDLKTAAQTAQNVKVKEKVEQPKPMPVALPENPQIRQIRDMYGDEIAGMYVQKAA